jgi:endonuclease/exonuclease/phosphatase family metal-dependent hydrolase
MRNAPLAFVARRVATFVPVFVCIWTHPARGGEPVIRPDEGRPRISWEDAGKVVGRTVAVCGRVIGVNHTKTVHFLNFDTQRPPRFAVVIYDRYLSAFPQPLESLYADKPVRVRGMVTTYREQPQIQITSPAQIEVLDALPPLQPLAEPKPWSGEEITVATYNILNLFDHLDDPDRNDETTKPKPRDEMERVAGVIRRLNADVLALQEVENREYLQRFVDVFLADMAYGEVVLFEGNDDRGIDVALLSRLPVGVVRSHRHMPFPGPDGTPRRYERDVLAVELRPAGADPFEVWVVHLKSNFGGREAAEPIRIAESVKLRSLIDERLQRDPGARLLVCGDFNDLWDSTTIRTIMGGGPAALRCPIEEVPEDARITYNQEPHRSMIDFILATPAMAERYVAGSYRIEPGSIATSGSDHNPVRARFRTK